MYTKDLVSFSLSNILHPVHYIYLYVCIVVSNYTTYRMHKVEKGKIT